MDYSKLVDSLTPDMVAKFTTAIELGRWENGDKLTPEQTETAMQAVMLWQAKNQGNHKNEPFVVGEKGELYTGKGKSHEIVSSSKVDDDSIILKKKM